MKVNGKNVVFFDTEDKLTQVCAISEMLIPVGTRHLVFLTENDNYRVLLNQLEDKSLSQIAQILLKKEVAKKNEELELKINKLEQEVLKGQMIEECSIDEIVSIISHSIDCYIKEERFNLTFIPCEKNKYACRKQEFMLVINYINYCHEEIDKLKWYNISKRKKRNKQIIECSKKLNKLYDQITRYEEDEKNIKEKKENGRKRKV